MLEGNSKILIDSNFECFNGKFISRQQYTMCIFNKKQVVFMNKKVNIAEKFSLFHDHWSPKVIAQMNQVQFKLVKIQGEFTWHDHKDTDEVFIVIDGEMAIEFEDKTIKLSTGEMFVVPKGIKHKPFAVEECKVMIIEPVGVINTGEADSALTADNDIWI